MSQTNLWNCYMRSYDFLNCVDGYKQNMNDIVNSVNPSPGMRVLDAGSGTGNLSILLKQHGADVTSCDFSSNAITQHRQKDPCAVVFAASLEKPLPLDNMSFDVVCCASVLFALSKQGCEVAVREFQRVLRPGGLLVVTVGAPSSRNSNLIGMHLQGLIHRMGRIRGLLRGIRDIPSLLRILYYNAQLARLPDWQGFHRFTAVELTTLISNGGFANINIGQTYGGCFFLLTARKGMADAYAADAESSIWGADKHSVA